MPDTPRWFTEFGAGHSAWYVTRFRRLAAEGADLAGEARLVDALVPRGSRILDAGCGPGRTAAALYAAGHEVVGVDVDPALITAARTDHPGPRWLVADLTEFEIDGPPFDAAVLAGNVMVFLAPGSEVTVLQQLTKHVRPDGVIVTGFATDRPYSVADFDRDCATAGLDLDLRLRTWDLRPWRPDAGWAVSILRRR